MNLPNKLTIMRMILVLPVVALLCLAPERGWLFWLLSGIMYGISAITDTFDGHIARKNNMITDFGKLMDPVADKLLVTAVFTCFVSLSLCSPWVLIIILAREFLVTSIRMVASGNGVVIPANSWGKIKTITQMVSIGVVYFCELAISLSGTDVLPSLPENAIRAVESGLFWLSAVITIASGAVYVYQSRELFKNIK